MPFPPVKRKSLRRIPEVSDACRFCDYRGACMLDKQIPGGKGRRIRKMSFDEVYERIREEMEKPTKE